MFRITHFTPYSNYRIYKLESNTEIEPQRPKCQGTRLISAVTEARFLYSIRFGFIVPQ